MLAMSAVVESLSIAQPREMFSSLNTDNDIVLLTLTKAYQKAEELGHLGISNFLQDRLTVHEKHGWMLRATIKNA
jgi:DNA-binding ferritin-like protein